MALAFSGSVKQSENAVPMSSARGMPVTLTVASFTSVIIPCGLIATSESRLDSIIERPDSMACLDWVTSWVVVDAPMIAPSASRIGETVNETGRAVPSLRIRMVWRCSMCWPALILARMVSISPVRSLGQRTSMDLPMISSLEYPYILSEERFQLEMMPSSVLAMMASFEFSTIAVMRWAFSRVRCRSVTSSVAVITNSTPPVSMGDKQTLTGSSVPSCCRPFSSRSSPMEVGPGVGEVRRLVLRIDLAEVLRDQGMNGLADQVVSVIPEQLFRLLIDKPDHACLVHPHQGIRHRLQQAPQPRQFEDTRFPF